MSQAPQTFASVWDALEDAPEAAHNLQLRAQLMRAISEHIQRRAMTQTAAAHAMRTTQPRVSALMSGHIERFSLDALVEMAHALGLRVQLQIPEVSAA